MCHLHPSEFQATRYLPDKRCTEIEMQKKWIHNRRRWNGSCLKGGAEYQVTQGEGSNQPRHLAEDLARSEFDSIDSHGGFLSGLWFDIFCQSICWILMSSYIYWCFGWVGLESKVTEMDTISKWAMSLENCSSGYNYELFW